MLPLWRVQRWVLAWCGSMAKRKSKVLRFLARTKLPPARSECASFGALIPGQGFSSATWIGLSRAHPGVTLVLTAKDVPGIDCYGVIPRYADQPVFAHREARFRGEAVAAVVGDADALEALDLAEFPV